MILKPTYYACVAVTDTIDIMLYLMKICDWAWENRYYLHNIHLFISWHLSPVLYVLYIIHNLFEFLIDFCIYDDILDTIKTSGSESRGQEEAVCIDASSGLRDHYSELFTRMAALKL